MCFFAAIADSWNHALHNANRGAEEGSHGTVTKLLLMVPICPCAWASDVARPLGGLRCVAFDLVLERDANDLGALERLARCLGVILADSREAGAP